VVLVVLVVARQVVVVQAVVSELIACGLSKLNIEYNEIILKKYEDYADYILEYCKKINITGIRNKREIIIKHFFDSLIILNYVKFFDSASIIDIGTGAGFPGIPLKIILPRINLTLLDSKKKNIDFLKKIAIFLGLKGLSIIYKRAEKLAASTEHKEQYDFALTRAVGSLKIISQITLPFLKIRGLSCAYKGNIKEEEISDAENVIEKFGGRMKDKIEVEVPYLDAERRLIIIEKVKRTDMKLLKQKLEH